MERAIQDFSNNSNTIVAISTFSQIIKINNNFRQIDRTPYQTLLKGDSSKLNHKHFQIPKDIFKRDNSKI